MSCSRRGGIWQRALLTFDDVADAVLDDHNIRLDLPGAGDVVTGRFLHPTAGTPLPDTLTDGTCRAEGVRPRLTFTRRHAGGTITTLYTGKVAFTAGPPQKVFVRGRFTRTTVGAGGVHTIQSGDWETEKPT